MEVCSAAVAEVCCAAANCAGHTESVFLMDGLGVERPVAGDKAGVERLGVRCEGMRRSAFSIDDFSCMLGHSCCRRC